MSVPKFVQYINLRVSNNEYPTDPQETPSSTIPAVIEQDWNKPIIKNANKYSLAIERLEISSSAVPMYPAKDAVVAEETLLPVFPPAPAPVYKVNETTIPIEIGEWSIGCFEITDAIGLEFAPNYNSIPLPQVYSLAELLDVLNNIEDYTENLRRSILDAGVLPGNVIKWETVIGVSPRLFFRLQKSGKIEVYFDQAPEFGLIFGKYLAQVLGIPQVISPSITEMKVKNWRWDSNNEWRYYGTSSCFDKAIRNKSLLITSDLPIISDIIGASRATVLTDFNLTTAYSQSVINTKLDGDPNQFVDPITMTYNPPQEIVYEPKVRRFLEFSTNIEISRLRIHAYYVSYTGEVYDWLLRPGEFFALKLGLYLK